MRRPITAYALAGLCALATAAGAETASGGLAPFKIVAADGTDAIPDPLTDKPGDPAAGAKVVVNRRQGNCLGCHQISSVKSEDFHGEVGPSLDGVAGRWDAAHLRMIVVNPKHVFTEATVMPAFYRVDGLSRVRPEFQGKPILTAQQVEDVVAYLTTLK
ncbi:MULTISPECIES: sulfur oxidation c-type cytochrome SoxX [Methylobacteriaceae]|jgi:sulfur-oxidizing protein SoxX|uniref:Cytochrome c SoxX n=4 Tax=Methylobacteriaceae TaxID=119045 RepID=C5AS97_METEA|nr:MULTISPECIES: sulfur oxidation c-type cytochrome SoxX [Methylobacteriaceae]MBY0140747.1 sulfur oxidation c-type cytochrome SoxX [Methylorubrum populi]ACS40338.1 cytochrome c SoxX precursor [Methylorubrum extorquens AM1]MBD8908375.1 sulfur oxidation c-type cytochrome SoxX [Methylorubrum zatmanii]MBK3403809.1 sulfur oxidation c-type cytochrome SoxX [Methylorubrum rhodesianum]MCP1541513.1 sulfur-oxidizing protein SoxX [Methylorubrum extorquens]